MMRFLNPVVSPAPSVALLLNVTAGLPVAVKLLVVIPVVPEIVVGMFFPYAVNVPDVVKVWIVYPPELVTVPPEPR